MNERKQLEETITALEAKREALGNVVVETAIASLRAQLAALDAESTTGTRTTKLPTPSLPGERRVVTILFCDVKGSTAMVGSSLSLMHHITPVLSI